MTGEITDWDDAYSNGAHIPGAADYPPKWNAAAAAYRDNVARAVRHWNTSVGRVEHAGHYGVVMKVQRAGAYPHEHLAGAGW